MRSLLRRARLAFAVALLVAAGSALGGCGARASDSAPADTAGSIAAAGPAASVGFRTRDRLHEHYRKHGREFGHITQSQYLALAQTLRDRPAGGDVLELRRADGVVTRFDRASGAFIAFDPDGTIRTFFRPNDGEAYFRRQARRAAEP
ncbi:MAG TPA: hypothetical protein VFW66_03390 [Gemmatimonadales bacterium]|nr:hypothetical protein [Gemmatimonadales bacterium]